MANNIIKYMGNNIGKSLQEENSESIIKEIFSLSKIDFDSFSINFEIVLIDSTGFCKLITCCLKIIFFPSLFKTPSC